MLPFANICTQVQDAMNQALWRFGKLQKKPSNVSRLEHQPPDFASAGRERGRGTAESAAACAKKADN